MKKIWVLLIVLFLIPSILAIDVTVDVKSSDEIMIIGLDEPTTFVLDVTNNGPTDDFLFYTFFGTGESRRETISIPEGVTKEVEFKVSPRSDFEQRGIVIFNLFIKASDGTEKVVPLDVRVLGLEDVFEVGAEEFNPEANSMEIYIKNTANAEFKDINARFKSAFFDFEETFSLIPYEKKNFDVQLDKEEFSKIMAGFYTLESHISVNDQEVDVDGIIKFSEKNILETNEDTKGFIIRTKTITKENKGNTISDSETIVSKNIITRLFTTLVPQPDIVERQGAKIFYTWERQLKPGETLEVTVKTNWFLPLLVILLIVAVVILTKKFAGTDLVLRKRVSFVHAKGGEFALRIALTVHARRYIERVNIIDRLPPLVKVHGRFGVEEPTRIDEKTKRIEWNFEKLEAGEIRTISYIIYSKIGVLGKFALPTATAIYEKEGNIKETESNKTFFISEQLPKPTREE